MKRFKVGVDIGGTFTDVVFLSDGGEILALKVASTPDDYSRGVLEGIQQGITELGIEPGWITDHVGHAFTIATNAILEDKGARTALITTKGFRDVLEFKRNRVPRLYDLTYEKPPALVRRHLRFEVDERVNARGEVLRPLDSDSLEAVVEQVAAAGAESVVVSLLHCYANPAHEQQVAAAVRRRLPQVTITLSSELLPIIKEYERTSTAVINGYVRPVVDQYLQKLMDGLQRGGVKAPLMVMQSNGGMATAKVVRERPAFCIESGPAAGVMGAYHLGRKLGIENLLTFDMGGTTAKASIIEGGELLRSKDYEVGAGLNVGHRLLRGAGHLLAVPAIDVAEVGAGGGSIATVDDSGSLRVGPRSAGAAPGPACYSRGGDQPTVTDANVLLGYVHPRHLLGGKFPIDYEKARDAVQRDVATRLGVGETEAAHGIHALANSNMSRALKAVSSERGRDPRRFVMFAFGGNGPVHAANLAEMTGIRKIVVPPYPGVFSAFGLLLSDMEHHLVRTYFKNVKGLDLAAFKAAIEDLQREAREVLGSEQLDDARQEILTSIEIKYEGQGTEIAVPLPPGEITAATVEALKEGFDAAHERDFGHRTDALHQIVNIRVVARGLSDKARVPERIEMPPVARKSDENTRRAYFGRHGWQDCPVLDRGELRGGMDGPLLVEEYDSTTVVPPGWRATVDARMNILLEMN